MKLLSGQHLERMERAEMEKFSSVACLRYKLVVNIGYTNKYEEK